MELGAFPDWIREHRVCFEVAPLVELKDGKRVQVGFDVALLARHPDAFRDGPGSAGSYAEYAALRDIARAVLPPDSGGTRSVLAPFDAALHLRPEAGWAPEVELHASIVHDGTLAAAGDQERRAVGEVQARLRGLGARARTWGFTPPARAA